MLFGSDITTILYLIPVLLFTVAMHECMHATVAYKLGDMSQKLQGRMTLYPFAHLDPIGFISILLIGFGWGKPVYVDDSYFKNRSRDNMLVALAGPLANLGLAILLTIVLKLMFIFGGMDYLFNLGNMGKIVFTLIQYTIIINVTLAVFNMLPIHPFDGGKIVRHFLPSNLRYKFDNLFSNGTTQIIILILLIAGAGGIIISPIVNFLINILNYILML